MNVSREKVSQSIQITLIDESINHPANQREADGCQTKILVPEKERERGREADDESTLVSCRLFSWPVFGGITALMMPQQWWMAAVSAPSAVSVIMSRRRETSDWGRREIWRCCGVFECSTVTECCGRKLLPLTEAEASCHSIQWLNAVAGSFCLWQVKKKKKFDLLFIL